MGKDWGWGVRRTTTKTIRNVAQGKRPGRGSGGIAGEFINNRSISSMDMDSLPGKKFFVFISTGFSGNAVCSFVR